MVKDATRMDYGITFSHITHNIFMLWVIWENVIP